MAEQITKRQMKAVQSLWTLWWKATQGPVRDARDGLVRDLRLMWAGEVLGRAVETFKTLDQDDAEKLLKALKQVLDERAVEWRRPRKSNRALAHAQGTEGRRGARGDGTIWMPDAQTIGLVEKLYTALGWTRERYDAFVRSNSSPTRGAMPVTMGQYNAILSALKRMLRAQEKLNGEKSRPESGREVEVRA